MGTAPSSTGATGPDGPGLPLACVLHPTRRVITDSTTQPSFKVRARTQILRLHRQLLDERERHEQVVEELREQNKKDVVSLSSRVEDSEAQWSRLQQRMSELWLEVEGLKLKEHVYPNPNALVRNETTPMTTISTQTQETSSSNAATQTDEDTRSVLKLRLNENELKRWRAAFSHLSGTPEQMALDSKVTERELKDWRTAFGQIPGTPTQKAASSKEAINELERWRTACSHLSGTPEQMAFGSKVVERELREATNELEEWHTSFTHVSGAPAQRAEASKTFLRKFSIEQAKNLELLRSEKAHRAQSQTLKSEAHQLRERNLKLSNELEIEMSKRERLLKAFEEYQGTSNPRNETTELTRPTGPSSPRRSAEIYNHPQSPKSGHLPKRKRAISEPDHQQDEPLPPSQRRRIAHSEVVQATRRHSESTGTSAPRRRLDSYRPSTISTFGRLRVNESMPNQPPPLEKKWKHSMLKKEH